VLEVNRDPPRGNAGAPIALEPAFKAHTLRTRTSTLISAPPRAGDRKMPAAMNRTSKQRSAPAIVTAVDGSRNAAPITTTAAGEGGERRRDMRGAEEANRHDGTSLKPRLRHRRRGSREDRRRNRHKRVCPH